MFTIQRMRIECIQDKTESFAKKVMECILRFSNTVTYFIIRIDQT